MVTFEESLSVIDKELSKRRLKWRSVPINYIDFDDVAQIVRIHIFKKWHLYDQSRPLVCWLNRVITHQIRNIIKNKRGNYEKPCNTCAAAEEGDLCSLYTRQCEACPIYANWERTKRKAYEAKTPLSLEHHAQDVFEMPEQYVDVETIAANLHVIMEKVLRPLEWRVYKLIYVEHVEEEEAARILNYKTTEPGRYPGYKQIKNIKKKIIQEARKQIARGEVDGLL